MDSVVADQPDKLADRKMHLTEGDKILQDLAEETGGRAFFPYHVDDLDQSFQDIGDELRNQYSIAYIPTNSNLDGRYHRIRIEVPDHKGYQVRARRGYYARANTTPEQSASSGGQYFPFRLEQVAATRTVIWRPWCAIPSIKCFG